MTGIKKLFVLSSLVLAAASFGCSSTPTEIEEEQQQSSRVDEPREIEVEWEEDPAGQWDTQTDDDMEYELKPILLSERVRADEVIDS